MPEKLAAGVERAEDDLERGLCRETFGCGSTGMPRPLFGAPSPELSALQLDLDAARVTRHRLVHRVCRAPRRRGGATPALVGSRRYNHAGTLAGPVRGPREPRWRWRRRWSPVLPERRSSAHGDCSLVVCLVARADYACAGGGAMVAGAGVGFGPARQSGNWRIIVHLRLTFVAEI